jgi:predicted phosphodiesterase
MKTEKNKKIDLRVAIISDVHIGFTGHINENYYGLGQIGDQDKWWEYALRYFKAKGVDVVVVPGDMANATDYSIPGWSAKYAMEEMSRCGEIFRKVFFDTDVELVCVYGNHDYHAQRLEKAYGGDKTPWKDAFNEDFEPVFCKNIKGYSFVGVHWGEEKNAKQITAQAVKNSPDKPVFYIQHGQIKNTTCDTYDENLNEDAGYQNVAEYENIIALFGHTHRPITDEGTIWQADDDAGAKCTVVSCSTFNYAHDELLIQGENLMTKHALYLTVSGKDINIERLSFYTPEMLALAKGEKTEQTMGACTRSAGLDWSFTLGGERVMSFERRKRLSVAPEFSENAVAGLSRADNFVVVSFPSAIPPKQANNLRGYFVEAWKDGVDTPVSTAEIRTESHIDATAEHFSDFYHVVVPNLEPNTEYTFKVYALDCFNNLSRKPLVHKGKTLHLPYQGRLR